MIILFSHLKLDVHKNMYIIQSCLIEI